MGGEVGGHFLSASDSKMICVVAVLISVFSICTRISLRFYGSAAGRGSWVRHRATFVGVRLLRGTVAYWFLPDGRTICRSRAQGAALGPFPAAELPQICFC